MPDPSVTFDLVHAEVSLRELLDLARQAFDLARDAFCALPFVRSC